jgi:hypothetical protein
MDDANIPHTQPEIAFQKDSEHDADLAGRLQTFTQACSAMKAEIATVTQHIITGTEKMGKPPTFTEACSVMKDQMVDEAQQIIAGRNSADKSQTFENACLGIKDEMATEAQLIFAAPETLKKSQNLDSQDLKRELTDKAEAQNVDCLEIEQAKKALREANWFEQ